MHASWIISCLVYVAMVTIVLSNDDDSLFDHEINYKEEETGGQLNLKSKGKLSDIIDLDQTPAVKRVLCKGNKILVALKKDEPDVTSWKKGQLIIGSEKWKCSHNTWKFDSQHIYAKVEEIKRPKEYVVEIHTSSAGPLDMFDEAEIKVHYEQGKLLPTRHRRYLSNPLRTALNQVDWNASFTENIPFNLNHNNQTEEIINLFKQPGPVEPEVNTDADTTYGNEFLFKCFGCHGYSQISYYFELRVFKVNNKAVIKKYIMEMDLNSHIQQNYSLYTDEEITLTKTATLWETEPAQIFQTEIAKFKTLPPILLTVDYESRANIALKSATKDATRYTGDFTADGRTVISQSFIEGKPSQNEVTTYDWTVTSTEQHVDTNATMNATFTVYQNVTILPAVSWAMKDVDMNLGPPIQVSMKPTINVVSTTNTVKRCHKTSVAIDSNVTVAETDFSVDAFGIHIWNVKLMNSLTRKLHILDKSLLEQCHADCHGPIELMNNNSMEEICHAPSSPILRGSDRYNSLHQLFGDYILFAREGINASWCGDPHRKCSDCSVAGSDEVTKCSTRQMNPDLATSITRLAKFVEAEWPDRKVFVQKALDEPTSDHLNGFYGNMSVFNEGRAAVVGITKPRLSWTDTPILEDNDYIIQRLGELAVCSNFKRVEIENPTVSMCVEKKYQSNVKKRSLLSRTRRSGHVEHTMVQEMLENLGAAVREETDHGEAPTVNIHESYPAGTTMDTACGASTGKISQDDVERFRRLVEYPLNDVKFAEEGSPDEWCGVETRQCKNCNLASNNHDDHWAWCGTRTMHMRLATRLQRLAVIAGGNVEVQRALFMNISKDGSSDLYMEGRAARLGLTSGSSLTMDEFVQKAILAGFDFVKYTSPDYIEVCVKVQDGLQTHLAQFPAANLVAVPLPLGEESEYDYPDILKNESRKPMLFDVSTSVKHIADHFLLSHFVSPGKRFIRLDSILTTILDLCHEMFDSGTGFHVIPGSGYRPRSVNIDNIATRHEKERLRYEMGQAVEIKPNKQTNDGSLFELGFALIKVAKTYRMQRLAIGIGCKMDRLYFELRPMTEDDSRPVEVWNSGNAPLFERLKYVESLILNGGTVVNSRPDPVICNKPSLGDAHFYFNFDLDEPGHCNVSQSDFCSETHEWRHNVSLVLQRRLTSAAGSGKLPRKDILPEITDCIVNTCGGCPSAGSIWRDKVLKCTKMIIRYLDRASTPFQPLKDKVSIFNTENHESAVHSLACHDGNICIENTQIYSLLMPVITAKYSHKNTDDLLFGGGDNPSPLLEIVEQELAWRAEGHVDVYVENAKDVNALRNVLKILMMYNKKVKDITINIDPHADEDDVITTIQRKVEQWTGSVCPSWSRLVTTPYNVETISHIRRRRSLERSKDRNKMKFDMKNWEVEWMLKS
ncbi:hypothetical protein ACF0H5_018238 [Mactra antiquata]